MKIFWSWQSDNDEKCGHYFVRDVLKLLVKDLNDVDGTDEAERGEDVGAIDVDHDTKDVAGSPPIAETILKKIRNAAVFVADVTPVGKALSGDKCLANPNVMIELGYAIAVLGHERIVLIMNKAEHAELNTLPFDLRHWRGPAIYNLPSGSSKEEMKVQMENLKNVLRVRIQASLKFAAQVMRDNMQNKILAPKFNLELVASEGELATFLTQNPPIFSEPTLEEIKAKHPALKLPAEGTVNHVSPLSKMYGMKIRPENMSREETEFYNLRIGHYYRSYGRYLGELSEYYLQNSRTLKVKILLTNEGTLPATDIDVILKIPEGLTLYACDKPPVMPKPPDPPQYDSSSTLVHSQNEWNYSGLRAIGINWTVTEPDLSQVRFHAAKLKHGNRIESDSFLLVYNSAESIGNKVLEYFVSANECPTHLAHHVELNMIRTDV